MDYISTKKDVQSLENFNHTLSHEIYRSFSPKKESPDFLTKVLQALQKIIPLPEDVKIHSPTNLVLPSHFLMGASFKEKETGNIYKVEKVCLQFYGGWYYGVLLNLNGSHCFLDYQNLSCINEIVIQHINDFHNRFELL